MDFGPYCNHHGQLNRAGSSLHLRASGRAPLELLTVRNPARRCPHLVLPFAGEGPNLAMYDGAELARGSVADPEDLEALLARYEDELFPKAERFARGSAHSAKLFFADTAQRSVVDIFKERLRAIEP